MELTFEWDPFKARANLKSHAVSFNEATTVFDDEQGITIFDPDHSESEAGRQVHSFWSERHESFSIGGAH